MGGHRDNRVFPLDEPVTTPRDRCRYILPGVSIFIILAIQTFHFGVVQYVWSPNKPAVDSNTCTCGCWDTVFKGSYESPPARYKHFYFNTTLNTLKIWVLTVVSLIAFYESLKYILFLYQRQKVRVPMTILFWSVVFSHYYSWWNYCNYWNDQFYAQWYHQLFFTGTELVSTVLVLGLCSLDAPLAPSKLMTITSIAITHILVSGVDQFVNNVLFQRGEMYQIIRDVAFMFPDLLHVLVPLIMLLKASRECGMPLYVFVTRRLLFSCCSGILLGTLVGRLIIF